MIVDSHTHFFDPSRPGGVPFPPKDSSIYRTILPEHFRAVANPLGVTGTVVVEASPLVEDNQWILDLAENDPTLVGLIGNLDIRENRFQTNLRRFSSNPRFLGVRARGYEVAELFSETATENLVCLSEGNLTLEVLVQPEEMGYAQQLAKLHPKLSIVLDHISHVKIDGDEPDAVWIDGVTRCAACPNIFMKLSRLPECSTIWPATSDPSHYESTIDVLWNSFGPTRLLWGSNWPVAEFASDYATTLTVVLEYLNGRSANEREDVLWRTSQNVYRWQRRD